MKLFIKISLLLLLPVFAKAQDTQKYLDSLHLALKSAANDTIRMDIYRQLGFYYGEVNRDSSLYYNYQSLPIAQKLKLKIDEARILSWKGYILMHIGNFPESLETFLLALKIAEDPASEKNARTFRGYTPREGRLDELADIHHNMGHLYGATGNIDKQISSYQQTIKLATSVKDTVLVALANMNLGYTYFGLNKLDSALLFEQTALALYSELKIDQRKYEGFVLNNIGDIYFKKGNIVLSRNALLRSLEVGEQQNNLASLGRSYLSLGNLFKTINKPDSSILYARKTVELSANLKDANRMSAAYSLLSVIYDNQQNKDSALSYLKLANTIKDSLNNDERKKILAFQNVGFDEQIRLKELEEEKIQSQTKNRTYAMLSGIAVFMLIAFLLYRNNRNRRKANELLQKQKEEIAEQKENVEQTLVELKSTQSQLIQSEKMASLGELTAGIAHEIQNPLNFVNNFSEVNTELIDELTAEVDKGDMDEVKAIAKDIKDNSEKINHHGKRADAIVKGMLQHSRSSTRVKEPTDINALADEYLRLSYHGLRAKDKDFNAVMKTDFDATIGKINIIPQDIGRALLNLYNNAFYAVTEKKKSSEAGYEPTVSVTTKKSGNSVLITVSDNGGGIPKKVVDKIFQPFFTTKPTGQGTGLGLSLSYDIVKAHGGEIKVETKEGEGSEFIIQLPVN